MAPVIGALRATERFEVRLVVTAQHREMLDQVLQFVGIDPDIDLDLMQRDQRLDTLAARIVTRFGEVLDAEQPDRVLVHGDTLTSMMATLASYFRRIPVGHVEAGLRSGNLSAPWPEEGNRRITSAIADLHFAPTQTAAHALLKENVDESCVHVVGNTVIDSLLDTRRKIAADPMLSPTVTSLKERFAGRRIICLTAHRRENHGEGIRQIAAAICRLSDRSDIAVAYPVHRNPRVMEDACPLLENRPNVALLPPLDYPEFVALMEASHVILTDSGGVQEEAPSLGKPVLVMRGATERPEGVEAGTALLVGANADRIFAEMVRLLDDPAAYAAMAKARNPYGDGKAAGRIADILTRVHFPSIRSTGA